MKVICHFCKIQNLEKADAVVVDGKNFHPKCAKEYLQRKELSATICRIFHLKAPGPKNYAFMSKFHKAGMTYSGMNGTLVYWYDIMKHSVGGAREGIGIIPYVYDQANQYYKQVAEAQKRANSMEDRDIDDEPETNRIKMPEPTPIKINMKTYSKEDIEW